MGKSVFRYREVWNGGTIPEYSTLASAGVSDDDIHVANEAMCFPLVGSGQTLRWAVSLKTRSRRKRGEYRLQGF